MLGWEYSWYVQVAAKKPESARSSIGPCGPLKESGLFLRTIMEPIEGLEQRKDIILYLFLKGHLSCHVENVGE